MSLMSLIFKLGLNTADYEAGIDRAKAKTDNFGQTAAKGLSSKLAGAFTVGAIGAVATAGIKNAVEYADKIKGIAENRGLMNEFVDGLSHAAVKGNSSIEEMIGMMDKLAVSRNKALEDPKGADAQAFEKLGVTMDDLKSKRLEDLFLQIGKSFEGAVDPQNQMVAAMEVMGKAAPEAFGVLGSGLEESIARAKELNLLLRDEVTENLADVADKADDLAARMRVAFSELGNWVLGAAKTAVDSIGAIGAQAGAIVGALESGKTYEEARQAGFAAVQDFANEAVKGDEDRAMKRREKEAFLKKLREQGFDGDTIGKEKAEKTAKEKKEAFRPDNHGDLARIGGFGQGGDSQMRAIAAEQLRTQREIANNTRTHLRGRRASFEFEWVT